MEDEKGQYVVTWFMTKKYKRRGLWNRLTGKTISRVCPMKHWFDSEEIAKYGYEHIRNNGGIEPYLLKVVED